MITLENTLGSAQYIDKTVIDSEHFANVAYHVERDALAVLQQRGGKVHRIYGSMAGMRQLALELLEVVRCYEKRS